MQHAVLECCQIEIGSIQQNAETLKKFNHEIYQWPMNIDFNDSDQNLYRSLFITTDLKKSEIARTNCQSGTETISREAIRDSDGHYSHEIFVPWNNRFQQEFFARRRNNNLSYLKN